jgi:hypothetical protein
MFLQGSQTELKYVLIHELATVSELKKFELDIKQA